MQNIPARDVTGKDRKAARFMWNGDWSRVECCRLQINSARSIQLHEQCVFEAIKRFSELAGHSLNVFNEHENQLKAYLLLGRHDGEM
jgi:hypothetical protein